MECINCLNIEKYTNEGKWEWMASSVREMSKHKCVDSNYFFSRDGIADMESWQASRLGSHASHYLWLYFGKEIGKSLGRGCVSLFKGIYYYLFKADLPMPKSPVN